MAIGVERAGVLVGLDAGIGAEVADHHLDGVERAVPDRRDAGVGAVQRVTLIAVVGARALAEIRIASFSGGLIEFFDRRRERLRIDPGLGGEFGQRGAAQEIAGAQMMTERHRKRRHAAEAVFA